jgi:thioredoxin reductase (NADPH)
VSETATTYFGGVNPLSDSVAFPELTASEMSRVQEFGELRSFAPGEPLFCAGDYPFDCYVILSGEVRVVDISSGKGVVFVRYGAGRFTGDIDLLTRRPSVVSCEAETAVEAVRLTLSDLRQIFTRVPQLGGKFWRSFQRRRELLLVSEFRGLTVYGRNNDKAALDTVELLFRNSVPHEWRDVDLPENARELGLLLPEVRSYPVVAHGSNVLFEGPTKGQLADYLGLRRSLPNSHYDVLILGAGPAGLGAAVYSASEGLSTLVLDASGPGGQAGSTSRIENYAGFPDGISGQELGHLTYLQALKFGADFHVPSRVSALHRSVDGSFGVTLEEGEMIAGRSVIIATGVAYRLLDVHGLASLQGAGVYYSATNVEARRCANSIAHVVGGGNSAGQAAMFLSEFADEVFLLVRSSDLSKMSSYLSERVVANEKVKIRFSSRIVGVEGTDHLRCVHIEDPSGGVTAEPTAGLFVFIGARPRTGFLAGTIEQDDRGFLITGPEVALLSSWREDRPPCSLETSMPGVFAAGDCRQGTPKRVAFAIGDGAAAVTSVHNFAGRRLSKPIAI